MKKTKSKDDLQLGMYCLLIGPWLSCFMSYIIIHNCSITLIITHPSIIFNHPGLYLFICSHIVGMISEVSQELFHKLSDEAPQILSDYYAHRNLLRSLKLMDEEHPLGFGSYASVLQAGIGSTGIRKVAVKYFKKLSPEFNAHESEKQARDIKNEVSLMKLMKRGSRHLVRYIDCLEVPGKIYLVMELCAAGDLEKMLYVRRKLKEEETKCIAKQLLNALKFLHDMGIIHGGKYLCHYISFQQPSS